MFLTTTIKVLFTLLTSPSFWSQIGFFISYIATCLIVLEVLRLIHSDASKRDVEKMLEFYTRSRTRGTSLDARRDRTAKQVEMPVSLAELERDLHMPPVPRRTRSPAAVHAQSHSHPEIDVEHTLNNATHRRSSRTTSADKNAFAVFVQQQQQQQLHVQPSQSPPRRLRNHSDSLNSIGSVESKGSMRRKRESSPVSTSSSSKSSSRRTSPTPRGKDGKKGANGLGRILKTRRE